MIISIRMSSNSIILSKTQDRVSSIKWACFESVLNSINLWISGFSWILSLFYMINYRFWASWRKSVTPFWSKSGYRQTSRQTSRQANRQTDIEHGFFEASTQKAPSVSETGPIKTNRKYKGKCAEYRNRNFGSFDCHENLSGLSFYIGFGKTTVKRYVGCIFLPI